MGKAIAVLGHYGSGKTEFSVNYAMHLKRSGVKTALLDLDIANPYFRSRERQKMLEAWDLGIGSVWVRGFRADEVAKMFRLPDEIKPVCLLPMGYPSEKAKPNEELHNTYRPLEEMVEEL